MKLIKTIHKSLTILTLFIGLLIGSSCQTNTDKYVVADQVPIKAHPFSLKNVKLLDGPFKNGYPCRILLFQPIFNIGLVTYAA